MFVASHKPLPVFRATCSEMQLFFNLYSWHFLNYFFVQRLAVSLFSWIVSRLSEICTWVHQQPSFIHQQVVIRCGKHLGCRKAALYWHYIVQDQHYLSKMQFFFFFFHAAKCIYLSGCDWLLEKFRFLFSQRCSVLS